MPRAAVLFQFRADIRNGTGGRPLRERPPPKGDDHVQRTDLQVALVMACAYVVGLLTPYMAKETRRHLRTMRRLAQGLPRQSRRGRSQG